MSTISGKRDDMITAAKERRSELIKENKGRNAYNNRNNNDKALNESQSGNKKPGIFKNMFGKLGKDYKKAWNDIITYKHPDVHMSRGKVIASYGINNNNPRRPKREISFKVPNTQRENQEEKRRMKAKNEENPEAHKSLSEGYVGGKKSKKTMKKKGNKKKAKKSKTKKSKKSKSKKAKKNKTKKSRRGRSRRRR